MTRLFYFTRTQEMGVFGVCFGMEKNKGLYSIGGENMNRRSFNKGRQRIKNNHELRPYFRL